ARMTDPLSRFLERHKNEADTGENRCVPCTVVNVGIAIALGVVGAAITVPFGVGLFAGSLVVIYFRGYLVPGTPRLTKRYLPARVLEWFGHQPTADARVSSGRPADRVGGDGETRADGSAPEFETVEKWRRGRENAVDPEQFLLEEGVVTPTEDGADIVLTEDFTTAVTDLLETTARSPTDRETIAEMFGTVPEEVEFKDRAYPALTVGRRVRKWPAEGALRLDVATHRALQNRTSRWTAVPPEQRIAILESLRSFREHCPNCGGVLRFRDAVVESCCAEYEVFAYECESCEERLLELDPESAGADAETGCQP
ncbi:MAG: hypothetical protein ACOCPV_01065, partial [Halodesulfurarchaeum sp.]